MKVELTRGLHVLVTRPVEEAVGVLHGLSTIHSVSRPGISEVTLEFEWGSDMDLLLLDVREKLDNPTMALFQDTPQRFMVPSALWRALWCPTLLKSRFMVPDKARTLLKSSKISELSDPITISMASDRIAYGFICNPRITS